MMTNRFTTFTLAAVIVAGALWGASPFAQEPRSDPRMNVDLQAQPPAPPEGFVPASSLPSQEQLPAAPLVIGAYAVAWVVVFGYLWSIWQRIGRVERDLADVSRRVAAGDRR